MRPWPDATRTCRLLGRLAVAFGVAVAALAYAAFLPGALARQARLDGLAGLMLGSSAVALTGLAAAAAMAWARCDPGRSPGRMARRPQAIVVPLGALAAGAAAWLLRAAPSSTVAVTPAELYALGGGAILLAFPLLVAERVVSSLAPDRLPESPALGHLLLVPVVVWPLAGCLEIARGLGADWTPVGSVVLSLFVGVVAAELAVRASANWFLPRADDDHARASIGSVAATLLRPSSVRNLRLAAPLRDHFGIDFSRSWALAYVGKAALPLVVALLLFSWVLTGAGVIETNERGIYERYGAPVAVLHPGLHLVLPWPLGKIRRVDYGVVHSTPLGDAPPNAEVLAGAEDNPPPALDRLWEQSHLSEVSFLIASATGGLQTFQSVSADIRVDWRIGLDDGAALRAAYAVAEPDQLVRASADRLVARFFAGRTLPDVLGAGREAMAGGLRADLQAALDRSASGIEILAVVIEAIHPPAGAAEAYHSVQAVEIMARQAVATERGRSVATGKYARTQAQDMTANAEGAAAESVAKAAIALRTFTADQQADAVGGQAFLLERYLGNVAGALSQAPLVILDHRLGEPGAPVLDLRPPGAASQSRTLGGG